MPLSIVAAKEIEHAVALLCTKPYKTVRHRVVDEPERLGDFLYDFRAAFPNYEIYYRFDPYWETFLEAEQVPAIKVFSASLIRWLEEHSAEENQIIQQYALSFPKIRKFAVSLGQICDVAMEEGCGLVGIGD